MSAGDPLYPDRIQTHATVQELGIPLGRFQALAIGFREMLWMMLVILPNQRLS